MVLTITKFVTHMLAVFMNSLSVSVLCLSYSHHCSHCAGLTVLRYAYYQ
jgi:hypothetical protein